MNQKDYKKIALSFLQENTNLIIQEDWLALYNKLVRDYEKIFDIYDFTWSAIMNILLSEELGYTVNDILSKVEIIPTGFFFNVDSIEDLVIPTNVHEVQWMAISECPNLYTIKFEDDPTQSLILSTDIIKSCRVLETVTLPDHCALKPNSLAPISNCPNLSEIRMNLTGVVNKEIYDLLYKKNGRIIKAKI